MDSEPPTKKQRFLPDGEQPVYSSSPNRSPPVVPQPHFFTDSGSKFTSRGSSPGSAENNAENSLRNSPRSNKNGNDDDLFVPDGPSSPHLPAFDRNTFQTFVGNTVPDDVVDIIRTNCGSDLERAVNMYFDGTWKPVKAPAPTSLAKDKSIAEHVSKFPSPGPNHRLTNGQILAARHEGMPQNRYIGAFGAEGWATRSGYNILKHGDFVTIDRQKTQAAQPGAARGKAKLGTTIIKRPSAIVKNRVDVIVRFCTSSGIEVGRIAKEKANWVSTLMDQNICKFQATCVYAPERLRTNDTVFLQIRCFLLRSAFSGRGFQLPENKPTCFFESSESEEEKALRLRQVALVRLFQEINLMPTRMNATAAKHKRKGLLDAAELDEQKLQEFQNSTNAPGSPLPSDEAEDGEELEQNQLDQLYRKAQSFDFNTPPAEPADTFAMTLRPYQKQSLHWMMAKEKDEKEKTREASMHPLWEEYAWPSKDVDDNDIPAIAAIQHFYVNPYSGDLSLDFPVQEQNCHGGILADEMGLGKTIQMMSLIHSHRSAVAMKAKNSASTLTSVTQLPRLPGNSSAILPAPCTTLVVAPMSLLAQWQSEAENASKEGTIKSLVYYGSDKNINLQSLCCEANSASAPDMVITSYGVILSEFTQIAKKKGNKDGHVGIFSLKFWRVILDEAHLIKNRNSKTAKACYELSAEHRWVLTGTPIVNRLEDLFSLVRFLRVEPWNNFSFWRTFITVPFESNHFMRALDVVQTVLEPLVMRRTKDMKMPDGTPSV